MCMLTLRARASRAPTGTPQITPGVPRGPPTLLLRSLNNRRLTFIVSLEPILRLPGYPPLMSLLVSSPNSLHQVHLHIWGIIPSETTTVLALRLPQPPNTINANPNNTFTRPSRGVLDALGAPGAPREATSQAIRSALAQARRRGPPRLSNERPSEAPSEGAVGAPLTNAAQAEAMRAPAAMNQRHGGLVMRERIEQYMQIDAAALSFCLPYLFR